MPVQKSLRKLSERVSVKDFGAKGDGIADDTNAIQLACNFASSNGRKQVFCPAGSYKITSTIYTRDTTKANGTAACGLVGEGVFSTRFVPSGDFTAINVVGSYTEVGGFSIEWADTARVSIPVARKGVEFCDDYNQVSQCLVRDILVMYAYNSFIQRDWLGYPGGLGTMYVVDFERLVSFRAADWAFNFSAANGGSTTHRFSSCWANCSDQSGVHGGKGFYLTGVNDVQMDNCAVDFCVDRALHVPNGYQCNLKNFALESCKATTHGVPFVQLGANFSTVHGFKEIVCSVAVGAGNVAYGLFPSAGCVLSVAGYSRGNLTTTTGTLYKVGINAETSKIDVLDKSIGFSDAYNNGWVSGFISWGGVRYASGGAAPNQGANIRGEYVRNMLPVSGSPKGWVCTVSGSPGTWVSEGNL